MSVETVEKQLLSCPSMAAKEAWVRAQVGQVERGKSSRDDIDRIHDLLKQNLRREAAALTLPWRPTSTNASMRMYASENTVSTFLSGRLKWTHLSRQILIEFKL